MANRFSSILPEYQEFIQRQHVFFVGSAPLSQEGHVNLSPKGYDSFRILSDQKVAYLDLAGSTNETSAHIVENGRVTIMFCAFEGAPSVLKLYGTGKVVLPDTQQWDELYPLFNPLPGARQIIVVDVHMVQNSCGFAVPFMTYTSERKKLKEVAIQMGEEALKKYAYEKNLESIDGLPTAFALNKSKMD